jgi:hypothetical protein
MPGPPKTPLAAITPESAVHNKGVIDARLRASVPIGKLGNAPQWMTKEEKKIWRTLVKTAPSQLGANDRTLMEIAVTLKAKLEAHTITTAELSSLISCLTKLGYIPVDRAPVEREKAADPLDRFNRSR